MPHHNRRFEDSHWLVRAYRKIEALIQMIQTALIIFAIAGGAVTAASVYQKAEAFDGRITANEQHIAELRHGIDVLNQKQDLTMQFFGIRNNVK